MLAKKCKYFYEMDEIFGARHNIIPPIIMEPGCVYRNNEQEQTDVADNVEMVTITAEAMGRSPMPRKRNFDSFKSPPYMEILDKMGTDRTEARSKRDQAEMDMRREELDLKKKKLSLKERKMEQEFWLMQKKIDLSCKKTELELEKLKKTKG